MTIGIIVNVSQSSGGIYHYTASLLAALYNLPATDQFIVFLQPYAKFSFDLHDKPSWSCEIIDVNILTEEREIQAHLGVDGIDVNISGFNYKAADYFKSRGIDMLIYPAPSALSFECGIPYIMAIHDLQHRLQPEFPEVSADGEWRRREYLFRNGCRFATGILVDSEVGFADVLSCYADIIKPERIHVLPFAPSVNFTHHENLREKFNAVANGLAFPERFFFYPAQFWAHKNHLRIIEAIAHLRSAARIETHLVLVGSIDGPPHERRKEVLEEVLDTASRLGVSHLIHYLGYVADDTISYLYSKAVALIMPTFFGPTNIPILEAWSFKCPVLTSDIRGVREQAGDAAVLVNPRDYKDITVGMYALWTDQELCASLRIKGTARLKLFSIDAFIQKAITIYYQARNTLEVFSSKSTMCFGKAATAEPIVSAIVSTYNSEFFIRGCLEDLTTQTLFVQGELEIVVVDSASPQNEVAIVHEFVEKYGDRIVYIRTGERETIYQAWNRGIKAASGRYVTNANTDDRHRGDALEVMAAILDSNPDAALVYADCFVTGLPNQTFKHHVRCGYHMRPQYAPEIMLSGCHMGPQPMWRRAVHDEIGYFSEQYRSAGDYEFWCRLAAKYRLMHISEFLGLYYENPRGFANSDARLSAQETISVQQVYVDSFPPPTHDYSMNYQYQGVVSPNSHVNICLVTRNNLPGLKEVIEALVRNTDYPHVITVADIGSSDGSKDFLAGLEKSGLITNLLLLDEDTAVTEAFAQAEHCEPAARFQLAFGNSIVVGMPGWLSAFVMLAENCAAPFLTNRIWSRDLAIKSLAGTVPTYVQDYSPETSCCMRLPARPVGVKSRF